MSPSRTLRAAVGTIALLQACAALAASECPGGSTFTEACDRQLAVLEGQLVSAYVKVEKRLAARYNREGYGGAEGNSYLQQAIESFRASNSAWREYRDKDCWYLSLRDGMNLSPDYANPVSQACKVERTRERIKALKN
jgi:uncharacterized protein YecT (DUF1311 family)